MVGVWCGQSSPAAPCLHCTLCLLSASFASVKWKDWARWPRRYFLVLLTRGSHSICANMRPYYWSASKYLSVKRQPWRRSLGCAHSVSLSRALCPPANPSQTQELPGEQCVQLLCHQLYCACSKYCFPSYVGSFLSSPPLQCVMSFIYNTVRFLCWCLYFIFYSVCWVIYFGGGGAGNRDIVVAVKVYRAERYTQTSVTLPPPSPCFPSS